MAKFSTLSTLFQSRKTTNVEIILKNPTKKCTFVSFIYHVMPFSFKQVLNVSRLYRRYSQGNLHTSSLKLRQEENKRFSLKVQVLGGKREHQTPINIDPFGWTRSLTVF